MCNIGTIKRGDTFSFTVEIKDNVTGTPLLGAADRLRCQGRDVICSKLMVEMVISETSSGVYLFVANSTQEWPKKILFDIQYTDGDVISSSETFFLNVEEDITRD